MARALAEEVHLDERYVAERLRDTVAGMCVYAWVWLAWHAGSSGLLIHLDSTSDAMMNGHVDTTTRRPLHRRAHGARAAHAAGLFAGGGAGGTDGGGRWGQGRGVGEGGGPARAAVLRRVVSLIDKFVRDYRASIGHFV